MEAIKFERPFHSHLSFSVICWSQRDYSLGRDVPYSPGPEKCLCLSVWHLLWWVIYLLLLHQGGKPTVLGGDGENTTGCPACDIWDPPVFLGLEVSRNPAQGSTGLMVKFSPSVDQLGCGCAQATPSQHSKTVTGQRPPSLDGMWWWGCFLGTRMRPERSSHDGKSKSTQQKQLVAYKYWCIWVKVQNNEQAPEEFTSKSTQFAKVALLHFSQGLQSYCATVPGEN